MTAPVPISADVIVPTFSLPVTTARVVLATASVDENELSEAMLFSDVLVTLSPFANDCVVVITPAMI